MKQRYLIPPICCSIALTGCTHSGKDNTKPAEDEPVQAAVLLASSGRF